MALTKQVTVVTRLPYLNLTQIRLVYWRGEITPNTLTVIHDGEVFVTSAWLTGDGKVTIGETDDSSFLLKDFKINGYQHVTGGAAGELTSYKFYSGIKINCDKAGTYAQIRGFVREPTTVPPPTPPC